MSPSFSLFLKSREEGEGAGGERVAWQSNQLATTGGSEGVDSGEQIRMGLDERQGEGEEGQGGQGSDSGRVVREVVNGGDSRSPRVQERGGCP